MWAWIYIWELSHILTGYKDSEFGSWLVSNEGFQGPFNQDTFDAQFLSLNRKQADVWHTWHADPSQPGEWLLCGGKSHIHAEHLATTVTFLSGILSVSIEDYS